MFKLVAVGGKVRGREYVLQEGENTIGRGVENDFSLDIEGISKTHLSISVNKQTAFLEDKNSSNGTFVNGKLTKQKTLSANDKIAIPGVIFQLVYVKEKKKIVKKKVAKQSQGQGESFDLDASSPPNNLLGKLRWIFKQRVMSIIYSFNEQYEWNILLAIILFIFIVTNISLTIGPVLVSSKGLLINEIAARGEQFASEVARSNSSALGRGDLERLNTSFLDSGAEGINSYELFDLEGRIVRPVSKLNSYTNDSFSIDSLNYFKGDENVNRTLKKDLGGNEIGIGKVILSYNSKIGQMQPVGIIAIRFSPKSLQAESAQNTTAYLEALIVTAFVGIFFFGMIYYLTTRPMLEMKFQIEEVLRGRRKELESEYLMEEIHPLRSTINSLLQRLRELQSDGDNEFQEIEDDTVYVRSMYEFMQGAQGPCMILNAEKLIEHINLEGEDLTGMRESSASGTSLLDSARDQGFAATVIDLCDQSANNEGSSQSDNYELTGKNYMIHVASLIGKDGFAKAFYITFILDE